MEWPDWLALRSFVRSDDANAVAEMLDDKKLHISVKMPDSLDTVLTYACRFGCVETVKLCIGKGVNVDKELDKRGYSPLVIAIRYDYVDIVEILCMAGADVNKCQVGHRSTLYWALYCPTSTSMALRIVRMLCEYGLEIGINSVSQIEQALNLIEHSSELFNFLHSCGFLGRADVLSKTLFGACINRVRKSLISHGKKNLLLSVKRLMLPDRVKFEVIFGSSFH